MSTVSNLIFHNANHYLTSPFGKRASIKTSNGNTATLHKGTDYGTNGKKIPQYAIEEGSILSCGKASDGALYVWVKYPRLDVKMLHYHLDSISVKKGQNVNKDTILGYTGMTGKSTGVHLHLGIKRLSGGDYIDPEAWSKNEYKAPTTSTASKPTSGKTATISQRYFKKYTGKSSSIVDGLVAVGADYSFSYRKKIAVANGITNYVGTATQNLKLLNLLKQGRLIAP